MDTGRGHIFPVLKFLASDASKKAPSPQIFDSLTAIHIHIRSGHSVTLVDNDSFSKQLAQEHLVDSPLVISESLILTIINLALPWSSISILKDIVKHIKVDDKNMGYIVTMLKSLGDLSKRDSALIKMYVFCMAFSINTYNLKCFVGDYVCILYKQNDYK